MRNSLEGRDREETRKERNLREEEQALNLTVKTEYPNLFTDPIAKLGNTMPRCWNFSAKVLRLASQSRLSIEWETFEKSVQIAQFEGLNWPSSMFVLVISSDDGFPLRLFPLFLPIDILR